MPDDIDLDNPRNYTPYRLASLTDAATPDSFESPGAVWLTQVRDSVVELWGELATEPTDRNPDTVNDGGALDEVCDGAVPIYTHDKWRVFVDLAAYNVDLDDIGGTTGDMDDDATAALYLIASELVRTLWQEMWDAWEAEQDDQGDDDDDA
jgi:hypothetical protein